MFISCKIPPFPSLRLVLGLLQVLVCKKCYGGANENDGVDGDAAVAASLDSLPCVGDLLCGGLWCWITLLRGRSATRSGHAMSLMTRDTCLLRLPTSRPSRISRASSLWPTSSNASVASWPPTSSRTSSPPLLSNLTVSRRITRRSAAGIDEDDGWSGGSDVRVLVDEARGVVDLVVDDEVEVLLGRVFGDVGVGEFLGVRHGAISMSARDARLCVCVWRGQEQQQRAQQCVSKGRCVVRG